MYKVQKKSKMFWFIACTTFDSQKLVTYNLMYISLPVFERKDRKRSISWKYLGRCGLFLALQLSAPEMSTPSTMTSLNYSVWYSPVSKTLMFSKRLMFIAAACFEIGKKKHNVALLSASERLTGLLEAFDALSLHHDHEGKSFFDIVDLIFAYASCFETFQKQWKSRCRDSFALL